MHRAVFLLTILVTLSCTRKGRKPATLFPEERIPEKRGYLILVKIESSFPPKKEFIQIKEDGTLLYKNVLENHTLSGKISEEELKFLKKQIDKIPFNKIESSQGEGTASESIYTLIVPKRDALYFLKIRESLCPPSLLTLIRNVRNLQKRLLRDQ